MMWVLKRKQATKTILMNTFYNKADPENWSSWQMKRLNAAKIINKIVDQM